MAAIPIGWEVLAAALGALGVVWFAKETADKIISKTKKGSVRQEFPGEWLDKTPEEIEAAAKKGDRSAQKAKKLLNDKRFDKDGKS